MLQMYSDDEIDGMISNVNASMAMEGFEPSKENDQIFREFVKGQISEAEAIERIKAIIKK